MQQRVLRRAGEQTPAAFRASVRRAVAACDTRAAEQRHQHALAERCVHARDIGEGMGQLCATLPLPDIAQIMARIDALARTLPKEPVLPHGSALPCGRTDADSGTDPRSMDQRRADAFTDLLLITGGGEPLAPGAAITVIMAADTLLGLDDHPAELEGWGTVPASAARALALDPKATLRRLLYEPTSGRMLDYARTTYTPPAQLAEHVKARDRTCRFPRCRRRATTCDIDHLHPWAHGGHTTDANCHSLCARHHHLKHDAGWTILGTPNGTTTWTTPAGHTYQSRPADYRDP